MTSKFAFKSAHKSSIFSSKAGYARCLLFLLFAFTGCDHPPSTPSSQWLQIPARNASGESERPLIYRALVPAHWIREEVLPSESIADTTRPLCVFYIREHNRSIKITLHSFPFQRSDQRIPPEAQIGRWKRQIEEINLVASHVLPDSHGGFSGLFLEGKGKSNGIPIAILGWSMQLAPFYERQLSLAKNALDSYKRADYTIKATGSPDDIKKHRSDIIAFSRSFELIEELPSPS